jgi:hypothetical protein
MFCNGEKSKTGFGKLAVIVSLAGAGGELIDLWRRWLSEL